MKKKLMILFIALFVFTFLILIIYFNPLEKKNYVMNEGDLKLYYDSDERKIYVYGLDDVSINIDGESIKLKDYLDNNSVEKFVEIIRDKGRGKEAYSDGGSILYRYDKYNVLVCKTLDGVEDVYIGNRKMSYRSDFCKRDISTFVRTYKVLEVSPYYEQQYENGIPVSYGNSFKVLLEQYGKEKREVIINNVWDVELQKGTTYEFLFMINNKEEINDDIEEIFKKAIIVEIRETDKSVNEQRQDPIK